MVPGAVLIALAFWPAAASAAWTPQPTGSFPDGGGFDAVSCVRSGVCVAAGSVDDADINSHLVIERYATGRWSEQPVPRVAGADFAGFSDVSCASATSCIAVGSASGPTFFETVLDRFDGRRWRAQTLPAPARADASPHAVSCPSVRVCVAVGHYTRGLDDGPHALIERYAHGRWTIQRAADGIGALHDVSLSDVSCPTVSACMAVGEVTTPGFLNQAFAERYDGRRWIAQRLPRAPGPVTELDSVSCAQSTNCLAISSNLGQLTERYHAGRWSLVPAPSFVRHRVAFIFGVSCPTANNCVTVGEFLRPNPDPSLLDIRSTLLERLAAGRWALEPTPGSTWAYLSDISCLTPNRCTAVGGSTADPGTPGGLPLGPVALSGS